MGAGFVTPGHFGGVANSILPPGAEMGLLTCYFNLRVGNRAKEFLMAGLEELKKKLEPLFDADKGLSMGMSISMDLSESSMVESSSRTINLLSKSFGEYNINELGLQKRTAGSVSEVDTEMTYRCASSDMHIFGVIGCGASSVVHSAVYIPIHRVLALKKINVFEKEKRQQLLNEIRTLCEAPCYPGLVEFHGAFYTPDSGQICIALEYMDGGSLADILRSQKRIPEEVISCMIKKLLQALSYLHKVRHLVHRDIKPANLLLTLSGELKITDFGISAGLQNSMAMCATFVGTVTYMSPERIKNDNYSYPADIWSLGLTILECGTGKFPYNANEGPANLMLQILYDSSPTPPKDSFSPEFCSFVDDCLQKDADARPTAEQLLSHPFIKKYEKSDVNLEEYVRSVVDSTQRLKDIADMFTIHYYLLFDGPDDHWKYTMSFYNEKSTFRFSGKVFKGHNEIFEVLSDIRGKLSGDGPKNKIVHVVEKLYCRRQGKAEVAIRASGSFIIGSQFLICGNGVEVQGIPKFQDLSVDLNSQRVGTFYEQFIMEPGSSMSGFVITRQELCIVQQ